MVKEGTVGKWSLFATSPKRFGCIAELYATSVAAAARAAALRQDGYTVDVTLSKLQTDDLKPTL